MDCMGDKRPYAMCVQMLCNEQLNSPIYTCKGSQDSVNAIRIYAGQTENMRRLIFVFPLDTYTCDADHKF